MSKKVWKEILSWLMVIVISLGAVWLIHNFIIFPVRIPSESMENTIMVGDRVMTYRLSYLFDDPERGDIIVFRFPDDETQDYIKRILGLPGETIEGKDGYVYIDGVKLEEPYVKELLDSDFGPYTVPEDSYFMMGDNRNVSEDSRFWDMKYVHRSKIKGKALFKYPQFKWFD